MSGSNELSREEVKESYIRIFREDPNTRKFRTLIVQYAERKGGLTLAFWKVYRGGPFLHPDFNHSDADPNPRTIAECAKLLRAPVSSLRKILNETMVATRPEWLASPEYQEAQERQRMLREMEKTKPKEPPPKTKPNGSPPQS